MRKEPCDRNQLLLCDTKLLLNKEKLQIYIMKVIILHLVSRTLLGGRLDKVIMSSNIGPRSEFLTCQVGQTDTRKDGHPQSKGLFTKKEGEDDQRTIKE